MGVCRRGGSDPAKLAEINAGFEAKADSGATVFARASVLANDEGPSQRIHQFFRAVKTTRTQGQARGPLRGDPERIPNSPDRRRASSLFPLHEDEGFGINATLGTRPLNRECY